MSLRVLPALLALSLVFTPACRRRRGGVRHSRPQGIHWFVAPATGVSVRVDATRFFRGAVRAEGDHVAAPPWTTSPLTATASLDGGRWLFATEDGTLYDAPSFTGPLRIVGSLRGRATPLPGEGPSFVNPTSRGAMFVLDAGRAAWKVDGEGAPSRMPLERVIHGAFVTRDVALAVVEPGLLMASSDGGAHFAVVPVARGVPLSVDVTEQGAVVRTSEGSFAWRDGALGDAVELPAPALRNALDQSALAILQRTSEAMPPVPWAPAAATANPDGTVSVVRGDAVVTLDPRTGAERSRVAAPGEDCTVFRARDGLRALCRHGGWATAVFALADRSTEWSLLRDELRAEPMGATLFDPSSRAWLVAAPCEQRPTLDRHLLCVYGDDGSRRTVSAPFLAVPLAMRAGEALVMDGEATRDGPTHAAILRDGRFTPVTIPLGMYSAQTATLDDRAVIAWELDSARDELVAMHRGEPATSGYTWRRIEVPRGARRGMFASEGRVFVAGGDGSLLARSERGGAFATLPSPVRGGARAHTMDLSGGWFCVGPWCRFGGNLTASFVGNQEALTLTRDDATPTPPTHLRVQGWLRCGPSGPNADGPDMDHGAAISGYALRVRAVGDVMNVSWFGATLQGAASGRWPGGTTEPVRAIGAVNATRPAALLERCTTSACEYAFVSPSGVVPLDLRRSLGGGVSFHAAPDGWLVRSVDLRDGVALVTLLDVTSQGTVRARRTYATGEEPTRTAVGYVGARVGLWVRTSDETLRFTAIDARPEDASLQAAESHDACAPDAPFDGVALLQHDMVLARGEGWMVEAGEWQVEEALHVSAGQSCMASLAGGEPREEPENEREGERLKVRTFVLNAVANSAFEGRAWAGHLMLPQRCTRDERRR